MQITVGHLSSHPIPIWLPFNPLVNEVVQYSILYTICSSECLRGISCVLGTVAENAVSVSGGRPTDFKFPPFFSFQIQTTITYSPQTRTIFSYSPQTTANFHQILRSGVIQQFIAIHLTTQ